MSKQKNEDIGKINCPTCGGVAPVRKNSAGKFYYDCPECGRANRPGPKLHAYIEQHAEFFNTAVVTSQPGPGDKPAREDAGPAPAVPGENKPAAPAKGKDWLDRLLGD